MRVKQSIFIMFSNMLYGRKGVWNLQKKINNLLGKSLHPFDVSGSNGLYYKLLRGVRLNDSWKMKVLWPFYGNRLPTTDLYFGCHFLESIYIKVQKMRTYDKRYVILKCSSSDNTSSTKKIPAIQYRKSFCGIKISELYCIYSTHCGLLNAANVHVRCTEFMTKDTCVYMGFNCI